MDGYVNIDTLDQIRPQTATVLIDRFYASFLRKNRSYTHRSGDPWHCFTIVRETILSRYERDHQFYIDAHWHRSATQASVNWNTLSRFEKQFQQIT